MTGIFATSRAVDNPYPGLRPFTEKDARYFFGRDHQIDELLERLSRSRFCAIVGLSGSGKSSLVLAGLIPALRRGYVARSQSRWRIATCRPSDDPIAALSQALRDVGLESALERSSYGLVEVAEKLESNESLLVVVDQFEELFRYKEKIREQSEASRQRVAEESARAADFVRLLLTAANGEEGSVYVVLTMRSDYLGDCARFRDLPEALNGGQYLIPRMSREQRREAIERPVAGLETRIASSLVQHLLNEIGDEPNQLPVLQHVLMRMWELRDDSWTEINDDDYAKSGGLEAALNRHAEGVYNMESDEERKLAEWIFKRLTHRGHSERETRDPAKLADLWAICGAETNEQKNAVANVVEHFRQPPATFLTSKDERLEAGSIIDITHESLIERWQRLKNWVDEESKAGKVFLRLADDAQAWRQGRKAALSGLELVDAENWNKKRNPCSSWALDYGDPGSLTLVEDYLAFSRGDENSKLSRQRRRLWGAVAGVGGALLLVCALFAAGFAWKYHYTTVQAQKDRLVEEYKSEAKAYEQEAQSAKLDRDEARKSADARLALLHEGRDEQVRRLTEEVANLQKSVDGQNGEVQGLKQQVADAQNATAEARASESAVRAQMEKLKKQAADAQNAAAEARAREIAAKAEMDGFKEQNQNLRDKIGDLTKVSAAGATHPAVEPTPASEKDLPPVDAEVRGVKDALQRYQEAYGSMSTVEVRKAWPSISKTTLKAMEEAFKEKDVKALHVQITCGKVSVSEERAQCDCSQTITYTSDNKVQKSRTVRSLFKFTKNSGTWYVDDIVKSSN